MKSVFQESGEGKTSSDSRDNDIKKWQLAPLRKLGQPALPRRSSEEKGEKTHKESTANTCTVEKASKSGSEITESYVLYISFISQKVGVSWNFFKMKILMTVKVLNIFVMENIALNLGDTSEAS